LDRPKAIQEAAKRAIAADLKGAILNGKIGNFTAALQNILDGSSIQLLQQAAASGQQQISAALDAAFLAIVDSDKSIGELAVEALRDLTFASSYNPGALDCLCNFIDDQEPNLSAIIITGDLATTGFHDDLVKARAFLEGSPGVSPEFDQTIAHVGVPKLVLPGNHDRYQFTARGFLYAPGSERFESVLSNHWTDKIKVYQPFRDPAEKLSVVIVAADFCLRTTSDAAWPLRSLNRLAQGRVHTDLLIDLKTKTAAAKAAEQGNTVVVIWAIHFPPYFPYRGAGAITRLSSRLNKNLIDEHTLISAARELNVVAILAGHTHQADDYNLFGYRSIRVLCAGSATQDDPGDKQCQIIEVTRNRIGQPKVVVKGFKLDTLHSTFA
jgi:predicted phosphodiesterase